MSDKPRGPAIVLTDDQAEVREEELKRVEATSTPGMIAMLRADPDEEEPQADPNG